MREIARIPTKKTGRPAMSYLEVDEVEAILKQPNQSSREGQRPTFRTSSAQFGAIFRSILPNDGPL